MSKKQSPPPPEVIRDLLLLVDEEVPFQAIVDWPDRWKNQAVKWAAKKYLRANDNLSIRVPKRPDFLP